MTSKAARRKTARAFAIAASDTVDMLADLLARLLNNGPTAHNEDDEDDEDDTRDILVSMQDEQHRMAGHITALRAELAQRALVPRNFGQVLILWSDAGTPACISRTVRLSTPGSTALSEDTTQEVEIPVHRERPIPAGAWIVSHGCDLFAVQVGTYNADMKPRSRMIATSHQAEVGDLIRVTVQREK